MGFQIDTTPLILNQTQWRVPICNDQVQITLKAVIDYYTTGRDFSADIMSRSQFYFENGF